jgi:hypothetical protein
VPRIRRNQTEQVEVLVLEQQQLVPMVMLQLHAKSEYAELSEFLLSKPWIPAQCQSAVKNARLDRLVI